MQQETTKRFPDDASIRAYAAGEASWRHLKDQGFTYYDVLEAMGRLGVSVKIDDDPRVQRGAQFLRDVIRADKERKVQAAL